MNGRRKVDKWNRSLQILTISLFLLFVIFIVYGVSRMISEVRMITVGQQELITRLSLQTEKKEVKKGSISDVNYVQKKDFIRFKNESNREIKMLKKEISRLKMKIEALKNPL